MLRTKALRPSLREKKRYVVYQVHSQDNIDMAKVQPALVARIKELLGVFHASQAGIMPVKFKDDKGIIKCNHTAVDYIKSCFVMITTLNNQSVQIRSINVSGMIKKAQTHL